MTLALILRALKRRPNNPNPASRRDPPDLPHEPPSPEPTRGLTPGRKWLFRLFAVVVVPVLALAGLEIVLRLAGSGYRTSLFKDFRVGRKEFVAINENFSLRFFPPQLARWPSPIMMEAQKPADTCRIFIFGESAARGDPQPAFSASRYMEVLLRERFPSEKFEVVNLGVTAIDSHVIVPMARECAGQQGDLWIIYMGNNEMVGPFGAATVFGIQAPPLAFVRASLAIQQTRVGQLMMAAARKLGTKTSDASPDGMKMFPGNQVGPGNSRREMVYRNFQRNLEDILRAARESGAKILLNTVAVNLEDCPPFASLPATNLPAADRAAWDRIYTNAAAAQDQGNFEKASQLYAQAAGLDPQFAELQFRWGQCLLRLTNAAAARAHFQLACDDDALSFRADSRINGLIRHAGRAWAGPGLDLLDAAAALETNSPTGICGRESFYDHVHLNFDGNYHLGLAWAREVEPLLAAAVRSKAVGGWASQPVCDRRLGLTDVNRILILRSVLQRLNEPPLSSQANNPRRLQALRDEEATLRQGMDTAAIARAREVYTDAILHAPDDYWLHENFAEFFEVTRDLKQAAAQWRRVIELMPCNPFAYFEAGRLLEKLGQLAKAQASLLQAVTLLPTFPDPRMELGNLYLRQGKPNLALEQYNCARQLQPNDVRVYCQIGNALSLLNRSSESIQNFRHALRLKPDDWESHFALGVELGLSGRNPEAESELEHAVRIEPGYAPAHLNLGVVLARQGKTEVALREFEETLWLDPGNKTARTCLDQIESAKSGKKRE